VRVERARQLLSDTDWKMSRIAATCGFYSAELFSVVFRRETGQSPTAYREHHQYRHPPG
jgi:transcriptional regulator GlxA family with amidase domain